MLSRTKYGLIWLIFMLAQGSMALGQFAIIKDPDRYANVRAGDSLKAKIVGRLHDGDVFTYNYATNGWVEIYFYSNDNSDARDILGHLHADRMQPIENLPHIPAKGVKLANDHLRLQNDSIVVELVRAPFHPKQHLVKKDTNGQVEKIDGKKPVGTDGNMPGMKLTLLRMSLHGTEVEIPATAWNDLYDPGLEECNIYFDHRTGFTYLVSPENSDGAGAYQIAWVFKDGRYVRRYVQGF